MEKNKLIAKIILSVFTATQITVVASLSLIPKQTEAQFIPIPLPTIVVNPIVPTTTIASPYDVLKDIGIAAAKQVALRWVNEHLTRFVDKVVEKYKIRNFLYYDQVLTNYYLNNFIRDKVSDPDLQQIYALLEAGYITGQNTGLTGQPNPNDALIPRLKTAIYNFYLSEGGIPEEFIYNPPSGTNNLNYFSANQTFWLNNPGFVEQNLRGEFGAFQAAATTAAQLEIAVGNGLKAGRFVGGTCSGASASDPNACALPGGTWTASVLDEARSFIDNPTVYIESNIDEALAVVFDGNYNPNNIWSAIGSYLGNFLYSRLTLDTSGGVLSEDPRQYVPDNNGFPPIGAEIDIDGDGISDGFDNNNDGVIDICNHGGIAPNCTGSNEIINPNDPDECSGIDTVTRFEGDLRSAKTNVNNSNPNGVADALDTEANSRAYLNAVADVLRSQGLQASTDVLNGNGNENNGDLIAIWDEGEIYAERYDAVGDAGDGDEPMRFAAQYTQYEASVPISECIP